MNTRDVQMLLASVGLYDGGIDGIEGRKTLRGVNEALRGTGRDWPQHRRLVGAGQAVLNKLGHEAGPVDGFVGHNTREALAAWHYKRLNGTSEVVSRNPTPSRYDASDLPRQSDVGAFYGQPGPQIQRQLTPVDLPFAMRLDWDMTTTVQRVTLHKKCARSFAMAMSAVKEEYGLRRIRSLGLDRFAGGYNHRKMRGGSRWSMHAYGCAVDIYAAPNGLRTRCPDALFCAPEYRDFLDIMEAHNWLPAIRLWGADAMHFQQARL